MTDNKDYEWTKIELQPELLVTVLEVWIHINSAHKIPLTFSVFL